jgi:hypothetical protein
MAISNTSVLIRINFRHTPALYIAGVCLYPCNVECRGIYKIENMVYE